MRTGNPFLRKNTFTTERATGEIMSVDGTINKAALLILLVFGSAIFGWSASVSGLGGIGIVAMLGGLVFAIITSFKPNVAGITAPIYAILQGVFLGTIAYFFEASYPGIASQAMIGTIAVFMVMMFLYRTRIIRVTEKLRAVVIAATIGIGVAYLFSFILSLFTSYSLFAIGGPLGIGISLLVIGVAAFNLLLDFDYIEMSASQQAPKYMEWYFAFSLVVTLIWLYIEMIRLISRLRSE